MQSIMIVVGGTLAALARHKGLLALEDKVDELNNTFFRQSTLMIVDANDPDKVRNVPERKLKNMMTVMIRLPGCMRRPRPMRLLLE